jgi:hypothetical protein
MEMAKHWVRNFKLSQAIIKTGQGKIFPVTKKMRVLTTLEIIKVSFIILLARFLLNEFSYLNKVDKCTIIRMMSRTQRVNVFP